MNIYKFSGDSSDINIDKPKNNSNSVGEKNILETCILYY